MEYIPTVSLREAFHWQTPAIMASTDGDSSSEAIDQVAEAAAIVPHTSNPQRPTAYEGSTGSGSRLAPHAKGTRSMAQAPELLTQSSDVSATSRGNSGRGGAHSMFSSRLGSTELGSMAMMQKKCILLQVG